MYTAYRVIAVVILAILILSCFLLSSCDPPPQKLPEGNIDVDSDIYIVPVGKMNAELLSLLIPKLETRFTTKVHLALDKRMPIPEDAYDYDAKKYVAMYILTELMKVDVPEDAKILGVANVDIFVPQQDTDFIFGQHHFGKNGKAAIISTYRMDPFSYVDGKRDDELLIQRMMKEAVHELGGVFGLQNCDEPECAMYLPRNLKTLDRKTDSFCLYCQKSHRVLQQPEAGSQPPE